jgi:curved DNA-binding protein CbpA
MSLGERDLERLRAWADVIDDSNYYEILGVLDLADATAIKAAFHDLAVAFHPDAYAEADDDVLDVARAVFRRVAEAYRVLSDPELRSKYDLALSRGYLRLSDEGVDSARTATGLKSLEDLCRSPAARLSARRADAYIGSGNLDEARRALKDALSQDGYENPELEERLEALDFISFAKGD